MTSRHWIGFILMALLFFFLGKWYSEGKLHL